MQFLVLAYSYQYPKLIGNLGNIALLRIAAEVGLIEVSIAKAVGDAYRMLRAGQHRLRLDGAEKTRIQISDDPDLIAARNNVTLLWKEIFKTPSNIDAP